MSKQITLTIKDNKLPFFMELVKNLDFVKIEEPLEPEPTKAEIIKGIEDGLKESKLFKAGKIKLKSARVLPVTKTNELTNADIIFGTKNPVSDAQLKKYLSDSDSEETIELNIGCEDVITPKMTM